MSEHGEVEPMFPSAERKLTRGNIMLNYPIIISRSVDADNVETLFADFGEVFMDEHGIQWVKFVARNGYQRGKEHMIRTDSNGFIIIRDDEQS